MRERRLRAELRRADLEHDRHLARLGQPAQRGLEGLRPAHGLEEEADHAGGRVVGEPATKSAASVTVSFPAEMTVRKPIRGPSETRISPIEPEWTSVATGPGTKVGCRLPIHGDGKPGVAMPMQLGPTIAIPASRTRAEIRSLIAGPSVARPRCRVRATTIARTPSTESTSSIASSMRPWPTPITTISGTAGQSPMVG